MYTIRKEVTVQFYAAIGAVEVWLVDAKAHTIQVYCGIDRVIPDPVTGAIHAPSLDLVLAIEDETHHASHFLIRDAVSSGVRPMDKYVDALPEIRKIQRYIVERARRNDVPVIENVSLDGAIGAVMELVLATADSLAHA